MTEPIELIEIVSRSPNRIELLDYLRGKDPVDKRELRGWSDTSRTTLQRNLDAMEELGWVHRNDREYSLTLPGRVFTEHCTRFLETAELTDRLNPVFQWLPAAAFDFDFDLKHLSDATVVAATPTEPYAPVNVHIAALKRSSTAKLVLPQIGLDAIEVTRHQILEGNTEFEVVVLSEIEESISSTPEYKSQLGPADRTDRYSMYGHDGPVPYYLGVFDETVQIGTADQTGAPKGVLESDDVEVYSWGERKFSEYKRQSRPVSIVAEGDERAPRS